MVPIATFEFGQRSPAALNNVRGTAVRGTAVRGTYLINRTFHPTCTLGSSFSLVPGLKETVDASYRRIAAICSGNRHGVHEINRLVRSLERGGAQLPVLETSDCLA